MARFGVAPFVALIPGLALVFGVAGAGGAYVIPGAEKILCSKQDLRCSFSSSTCLDQAWLLSHEYTPSAPDRLDLKISTRPDPNGNLLPVINASWTLKDDGGIRFLNASELHVVVVSTNQNVCVRYTFSNKLTMRSPSGEQWKLRSDVLAVEPGQTYSVSVENIPKPELDHSITSISRSISVPGCSDPQMKLTRPCIESGSLWSPNISLSRSGGAPLSRSGGAALTVQFSPDPLSKRYSVICCCKGRCPISMDARPSNHSRLSASCPLDRFEGVCCDFQVKIRPFFPRCGNDCRRFSRSLDLCSTKSPSPPADPWSPLPAALGATAVLLLVAVGVCATIVCRRKWHKPRPDLRERPLLMGPRRQERPTLLLIYSKDHPLYLSVVLKLAAFLQAHCGILVLLDLLDSVSVSQVGLMRWLELQRNKLRPNDKILVLCSRGVQSKWRAMCGQGHMTHQPDDLIGPFLSLFLPDMHLPGSMGRYIAGYFEGICSERDVPSFFDIAVKYKLMKHLEELYFRVLDMEKYEPLKVNHVQGIGPDEYFRSPPGRQLRNAVERFETFQAENPDWFENGETRDELEQGSLLDHALQRPLVSECVPFVREGPDIFRNEVLENQDLDGCYILSPEPNKDLLISENQVLNADARSQSQSVMELQPALRLNLDMFESVMVPATPAEATAAPSGGRPEPVETEELDTPWEASPRSEAESSGSEELSQGRSQEGAPVSPWSKADTSGSDQGYSSRGPDSDDVRALLQLQRELMSNMGLYDPQ